MEYLLFPGYHSLPQEQLYWSLAEELNIPLVRESLSRASYLSIKKNLHLSDNTKLDTSDKLSKIRPYLAILNKNFIQYGVISHSLSIDKQMIIYYGRHSTKIFMKGKPVRFGYKVSCLTSSQFYLFQVDVYTVKPPNDMGLGSNVEANLL